MTYTRSDYAKAYKASDEYRRNTGVGDFMTHLNRARRERLNSTALAKRISREWRGYK